MNAILQKEKHVASTQATRCSASWNPWDWVMKILTCHAGKGLHCCLGPGTWLFPFTPVVQIGTTLLECAFGSLWKILNTDCFRLVASLLGIFPKGTIRQEIIHKKGIKRDSLNKAKQQRPWQDFFVWKAGHKSSDPFLRGKTPVRTLTGITALMSRISQESISI